jgi:hypothetical protein
MFRSPSESLRRVLRSPAKAVARLGRKGSKHIVYFRIHRLVQEEEAYKSALAGVVDQTDGRDPDQTRASALKARSLRVCIQFLDDRAGSVLQTSSTTNGVWEETLETNVTLYPLANEKRFEPLVAQVKLYDVQRDQPIGVGEVDVAQFAPACVNRNTGDGAEAPAAHRFHRRTGSTDFGECLLELRSSTSESRNTPKSNRIRAVLLISISIDQPHTFTDVSASIGSRDSASQASSTESSASVPDLMSANRNSMPEPFKGNRPRATHGTRTVAAGGYQGAPLTSSTAQASLTALRASTMARERIHSAQNEGGSEDFAKKTSAGGQASTAASPHAQSLHPAAPMPSSVTSLLQDRDRGPNSGTAERIPQSDEASLWKRERDRFAKQLLLQAETFQEEIRELSATNSALRVQLAALCREREAQQLFSIPAERRQSARTHPGDHGLPLATTGLALARSTAKEDIGAELDPVPVDWDRERLAREWQIARAGLRAAVAQARLEVEAALRDAASRSIASLRYFTHWHRQREDEALAPHHDLAAMMTSRDASEETSVELDPSSTAGRSAPEETALVRELEQQLIATKLAHAESEDKLEELRRALREMQGRLLREQQRTVQLAQELSQLHGQQVVTATPAATAAVADALHHRTTGSTQSNAAELVSGASESRLWRRFSALDETRTIDTTAAREQHAHREGGNEATDAAARRRAFSVSNDASLASGAGDVSATQRRSVEHARSRRFFWNRRHRANSHTEPSSYG